MRGAEWTYISADVPALDEKNVTPDQKKYRAQEIRKARKQVKDTIDNWAKVFRGDSGKDYFEVGTVERELGWLEKEPVRTLCAQAQKNRPKPKADAKDPGAAYRQST